jgi:hypothetical protein
VEGPSQGRRGGEARLAGLPGSVGVLWRGVRFDHGLRIWHRPVLPCFRFVRGVA